MKHVPVPTRETVKAIKDLIRGQNDGLSETTGGSLSRSINDTRVCLLKAFAPNGYSPPLWDADVVVFEGDGTEHSIGRVLLDDLTGIILVTDGYYIGQEGGIDPTVGVPVFQAVEAFSTYPDAGRLVSHGVVNNVAQSFGGIKGFDAIDIGQAVTGGLAEMTYDAALRIFKIDNYAFHPVSADDYIVHFWIGYDSAQFFTAKTGGFVQTRFYIDFQQGDTGTDALGNVFYSGICTHVGGTTITSPPGGTFTGSLP